jgi:group II intron reverse transcriptase/maturase
MKSDENASDNRVELAVNLSRDELVAGEADRPEPIPSAPLLARVLERGNLQRALKQVCQNQGAPGIDGMTVDELPDHLRHHWPEIRAQLETGRYWPLPVKRVEIPKPEGKTRPLGIPTVLDRFIQQAIAQVVSAQWEPHFHPKSYGFRPQRSAHQAVRQWQADLREGYHWVVDLDLEAFFDRVNHDGLMSRLKQQVPDGALLSLINRYLKAGVQVGETRHTTPMGVPQGGPLSPVLANVVLDELDWELERRGHRFARYADDCIIVVKSQRAGERVMASVTRFVSDSLRLTVNPLKSAVDRPWNRKFLGFTVSRNRDREKPHGSPLPHHRADGSRTRRFGRLSRPVESPSAEAAQGFSARKPEPHLYPLQAHVHPVGCSHGLHWTTITPLFQVPLGTPFGPSVGSLAPRRRLPYYALC